jgi:hypothetical protein
MITQSDDDAADTLWGEVDGANLIAWAEARYHLTDLGSPPIKAGWWGNTKLTATGMVEFYAAVEADPAVGPWLFDAMGQMTSQAADGTDQDFGLAAQTPAAVGAAAFKQGWGGDDDAFNSEQLNSTGLLQGRYAVAIFAQHVPYESMGKLLLPLNALSAAVAPGGVVATSPATGPAESAAPQAPSSATPVPSSAAAATRNPPAATPAPFSAAASAANSQTISATGARRLDAMSRTRGLRTPIPTSVLGGLFGLTVALAFLVLICRAVGRRASAPPSDRERGGIRAR